ncbi:MAG: alpha-galactosidase [Anaerolineales bacterium]|nr:alpha-galactosidase [Anaerolineales bacterium]
MTRNLENASIQLSLDPKTATWTAQSRQWDGAMVRGARMRASFRRGRSQLNALGNWQGHTIESAAIEDSRHGPLKTLQLELGPAAADLHFRIVFALPQEHPQLLWQISVSNRSGDPVYVDELEMLRAGYPTTRRRYNDPDAFFRRGQPGSVYYQGDVQPNAGQGILAFLSNGWTSWSPSGVFEAYDKAPRTRLGFLRTPVTSNAGTPKTGRRGHFISEMYGVLGDRTHRTAILAGFLSQQMHFGALEAWLIGQQPSLRMWAQGDQARLDPGQTISTDWACLEFIHLDQPEPLGGYFSAVAREHDLPDVSPPIPAGWCTWYQYREEITPEIIRENLAAAGRLSAELPLDVIQIDDGFEAEWGDWLSFKPQFQEGLAGLAGEISREGFRPGIWLAPFIAHRRSQVARRHPEWLLRNRLGIPVNAGFQGTGLATALDLTHEGALAHAAEAVHAAAHAWGFPYLKLDFLYAAALPGIRQDPTKTRAQVLRSGLAALREAAGDQAFLVGCGCPLGSAIGLVDAMRIGPDVAAFWEPQFRGRRIFFNQEPDIPAAENAINSSLSRAHLHRYWWVNDPDCLLVRPDSELTGDEIHLLASVISLTGGSIILSDSLNRLPPDRLELLASVLPPIGKRPHVIDWFDGPVPGRLQLDLDGPTGSYHVLGLMNLEAQPADLTLRLADFYLDPQLEYFAHSFWDQTLYRVSGEHTFEAVPAHSAVVLALHPAGRRTPQYLGSSLHISQGQEVIEWESGTGRLSLTIQRPGTGRGTLLLGLPAAPALAVLNGEPVYWAEEQPQAYRIPVQFNQRGILEISWP